MVTVEPDGLNCIECILEELLDSSSKQIALRNRDSLIGLAWILNQLLKLSASPDRAIVCEIR